jgi:hypothetical protein
MYLYFPARSMGVVLIISSLGVIASHQKQQQNKIHDMDQQKAHRSAAAPISKITTALLEKHKTDDVENRRTTGTQQYQHIVSDYGSRGL